MGTMNKAWHARHKMPKNATLAQRVAWHRVHAQKCGCRPIPKSVATAMKHQKVAARK